MYDPPNQSLEPSLQDRNSLIMFNGCNGLKNFPQVPKIAYVDDFLPFLDPLHTIKTFSTRFPTRLPTACPAAFPARFSCKNFLQDFPTRISHKIFPQNFPARISHKNFLQEFPARFSHKIFPQDFPARISHKILPQEFPARISCKIFLSWILIGWLPITLFQMLNFHQSLPC